MQRIRKNAFPGVEGSLKSIESYLQTYFHPENVKFKEIVADFMEDIYGNMVFLQIKAFNLQHEDYETI